MRATTFHVGCHVAERDLLPHERVCPLCCFEGVRSAALRLQAAPAVDLLACPQCGGYSASRMPSEDLLRRYYSRYYENADQTVTFHQPQRFARHLAGLTEKYLQNGSISILDFGGGSGEIAKSLAKLLLKGKASAVDIVLVDYHREMSTDLPGITVERYDTLAEVPPKQFDLVLASAIVEHIQHPRKELLHLLAALQRGGVFYARTPSVASLFRLIQWLDLDSDFTFPAHLHDLGQIFWEGILRYLDPLDKQCYDLVRSRPSIVETTFRQCPLRTLTAHILKSFWRVPGMSWSMVGGWEVLIRRLP